PVGEPRVEIEAWVTEAAARRLVAAAGYDLDALVERARRRDFEPIPLGLTTSIALENELERTSTANVLGVLRGSDPVLADELVIYTAHHDHLGKAADASGDTVFNGARDNASGVAMVLEIGEAFAALPAPPRSEERRVGKERGGRWAAE